MPCATIHMLTAGRVLAGWDRHPRRAPFPVERPELRRSFLMGAMGPDMGFVPGVDRLVSELAHYVSSADLTRSLLHEARSPRQAAYAWGWATHHLTDVEIHPLVGRACGERLLGDRSLRLNSSDDLEVHVGMEVGLDLVFLRDEPDIPTPPGGPFFEPRETAFMARAFEATYRIPWARNDLHRSHRKAVARTARWPAVLSLLGRSVGFGRSSGASGTGWSLLGRAVSVASRFAPPESAASGFLQPLSPPAWLIRRVRELSGSFSERFQDDVESQLERLENRNLETGEPEDADVEHPDSEGTRRRLRVLRRRTGISRSGRKDAPRPVFAGGE